MREGEKFRVNFLNTLLLPEPRTLDIRPLRRSVLAHIDKKFAIWSL